MRKINCLKRIFVLLILIALTIPSLSAWTGGGGEISFLKEPQSFRVNVDPIKRPKLFKEFETGRFQTEWTYWFNNYFYLRGFFVRLKSSLFYLANFKRFFLPSDIRLISQKNGIVDADYHRVAYVGTSQEIEDIGLTIKKLAYVQKELNEMGKEFVCVLAYLSDWGEYKINPLYRYFENYQKEAIHKATEVYERFLQEDKINYFDAQPFLENNRRVQTIEPVSFYDAHWNRYGAGLAVIETLKYLNTVYKTNYELPQIKSVEISTTPDSYEYLGETYALRKVNLFLSLENAFILKRPEFPYIVYGSPSKKSPQKIVVIGDSFARQFGIQLISSKFADEKNIELYVNKDRYDNEFKRDIKTIVDSNNVIIIVYMRG
ncbi:MAG: hypothetical protein LBB93_00445, partial [Elusimicrobiota bacterium]|nr:hypothetical protein [Elusimicrobiota bacterium]